MYTGALFATVGELGAATTAVEVGLGMSWGVAMLMTPCSGAAAVKQICFGLVALLSSSDLRFWPTERRRRHTSVSSTSV